MEQSNPSGGLIHPPSHVGSSSLGSGPSWHAGSGLLGSHPSSHVGVAPVGRVPRVTGMTVMREETSPSPPPLPRLAPQSFLPKRGGKGRR